MIDSRVGVPLLRRRRWRSTPLAISLLSLGVGCTMVLSGSAQGRSQSEPDLWPPPSVGLTNEHLRKQWVTKLHYGGPEGDFGMDLVFRLQDGDTFSILAKDRVGRSWWELAVAEGEALSLERRRRTYCKYERAVEISALPLGPLEFSVVPQLILGRLPFTPSARFHRGEGRWSLQDERLRDWIARTDGATLSSWALLESGQPSIWWSSTGTRWALNAREQGMQLLWKNGTLRELSQPPRGLEVPEGYTEDCSGRGAFTD